MIECIFLTLAFFYSEKFSSFKKFDQETDDEDDFFDLDDFFSEFHGNKFDFQGFPPSILRQLVSILEAMQKVDQEPENYQRQRSFEKKYNEFRQKTDQDSDGQLYAAQLDTLLKRISPEFMPKESAPRTPGQKKVKQPDEEKIMDIIHGTFQEDIVPTKPRKRLVQKVPATPHHFGGLPPFDLPPSSSRTWGKTVISIRKQDGSYETRKMERSPDGQTRTTMTKTDSNGTSSTQSFTGTEQVVEQQKMGSASYNDRNMIKCNGYTIPCLW